MEEISSRAAEPTSPSPDGGDEPLFRRDGDVYVPHERTRGPWSEDAQHGGAVASLVAALVEARDRVRDIQVVRITYELLRPVPLRPLRVTLRPGDSGRSVDRVDVEVRPIDDDQPVVLARALRMRRKPVSLPALASDDPPPAPEDCPPIDMSIFPWTSLVSHGVEMRLAGGSAFLEPGPAAVWFRLRQPVVEGLPLTPLQRVCLVADFGNGTSNVAPLLSFLYVNADLTVAVHREAQGEWICLDSVSRLGDRGIGLTSSRILDRAGSVGHATQSLLVAART